VLATLLDRSDGETLPLPEAIASRYGGPLRMPARSPHVFANFVSTLDGVVSYDEPGADQAKNISGGHPDDRFMLAILRAVADAVVVGAGTLRKEPKTVWTAEKVVPDLAPAFAELRKRMGLRPNPTTVIVSESGNVDRSLPAFNSGVPVVVASGKRLRAADVVDLAVREGGGGRILTEGGPTLLGRFLDEGLVDELFLTIAPRLAGRSEERRRLALVEGAAFRATGSPIGRLVSVKAADDYLFTRYAFRA